MIRGKEHIILLFLLLAFAGCGDNRGMKNKDAMADHPEEKTGRVNKDAKEKEASAPIHSRFENLSGPDHVKIIPGIGEITGDIEYYTPVEDLGYAAPISGWMPPSSIDDFPSKPLDGKAFSQAPDFFIHGRTSGEIYISLAVDNDLFDYTDYYYTAGQSLELLHPAISASPFMQLLPGMKGSTNYYGLSLTISLYTPRYLDREDILVGDRPFAAFMNLGHRKYSLNPVKHSRLESQLELGVIGPNALGQTAQDIFHTDKPLGWVNQIANDIVVNYGIRFEQSILHRDIFDLAFFVGGQAGTLYDNFTGGIFLQAGKSTGRYASLFQTTPGPGPLKKRIRYYFNLGLENKFVAYDATLQGGLINRNSIYTLGDEDVRRYVFTGRCGAGIGLGRFSLEAEQVFLTREFDNGYHHFWFRIKAIVHLN